MYCKIDLIPKRPISREEAGEALWSFLSVLARNGQILKDSSLIKTNEGYSLYVTLPKEDSFDSKYDGIYVKRDRAKIEEIFDYTLIPLGENADSSPYCTCQNRSAIEMQTYRYDIDSVFSCCDCGNPIALYELPFPLEMQDDFYCVEGWQKDYAAMDMLWMNCLCDRFTTKQLVKIHSALNKRGIAIAKSMEEKLGYPVYYHLFCDDGYGNTIKTKKVGDIEIHVCPKCKQVMKRLSMTDKLSIDICPHCHLSYDAHKH